MVWFVNSDLMVYLMLAVRDDKRNVYKLLERSLPCSLGWCSVPPLAALSCGRSLYPAAPVFGQKENEEYSNVNDG